MTKPLPPAIKSVHRAWGPGVRSLRMALGYLEGAVEEYAEFAVHEFCHAALLGLPLTYGRAHGTHSNDGIGYAIEAKCHGKRSWHGDRHEIHTLAVESLVLRELGIPVAFSTLVSLGLKNVALFNPFHNRNRFGRCIQRARRVPAVRQAAAVVLKFIREGRRGTTLLEKSHV